MKVYFYENSLETLYYPSVNYKNFKKYENQYKKLFGEKPKEMSILAYDALGLIYFIWRKNKKISSTKDFIIKKKIKVK